MIKNRIDFFSKKSRKCIVGSGKKSIFAHLFAKKRAAKKTQNRSFTSCRYNSVGRVADL